jgi:hypothetical protein
MDAEGCPYHGQSDASRLAELERKFAGQGAVLALLLGLALYLFLTGRFAALGADG